MCVCVCVHVEKLLRDNIWDGSIKEGKGTGVNFSFEIVEKLTKKGENGSCGVNRVSVCSVIHSRNCFKTGKRYPYQNQRR